MKRVLQVQSILQQECNLLLQWEISDPRLQEVRISRVKLSRDLKVAWLYYRLPTVIASPPVVASEAKQSPSATTEPTKTESPKQPEREAQKALRSAGGFMRKKLAEKCVLRFIPELHFELDRESDSIERILAWSMQNEA